MDKPKIIFYLVFILLLVFIGIRHSQLKSSLDQVGVQLGSITENASEVIFEGRVIKEPDVRETNTKLTIRVLSAEENIQGLKILVTVNKYPEYNYGDVLQIKGNLQEPFVFEDFSAQGGPASGWNYKDYLKKDNILAVIYYPQIELNGRGPTSALSFFYFKILDFKQRLRQNIYSFFSPPQSSVLGALLLGDKNRISREFKEKLNIAGIRHLTAVSGMHIVIISSIILSLFLALGFWKKQAIILSLLFIFFFIALTGFQTSSIRAGIMGSLFLIGPLFGRKSDSIRGLILAGLIMLVINPFLIYSAGFQLSFAAVLGIILLSSTFKKYLKSDILAATFSAYIFTLPILIYSFGQISLAGPLTNLLVLPIIPILMILGFIASILGMFIFFIPVWFLLTYIVKITEIFSQPYFAQEFINIHWLWLLAVYCFLIPVGHYIKRKAAARY